MNKLEWFFPILSCFLFWMGIGKLAGHYYGKLDEDYSTKLSGEQKSNDSTENKNKELNTSIEIVTSKYDPLIQSEKRKDLKDF